MLTLIDILLPIYGSVSANFFEFILSLSALRTEGIRFRIRYNVGDSLVTRSRNTLISKYYVEAKEDSNLKYMLFLDSDVHMNPTKLLNMVEKAIKYELDIVGGIVPIKGFQDPYFQEPKTFLHSHNNDCTVFEKDDSLIRADVLTTGCILLSTKAVNELIRDAKKNKAWYHDTDFSDNERRYDVFQTGVRENVFRGKKVRLFLSEDWWMCYKLKDLGFTVWADRSLQITHRGFYDYKHLSVEQHSIFDQCRNYMNFLTEGKGKDTT